MAWLCIAAVALPPGPALSLSNCARCALVRKLLVLAGIPRANATLHDYFAATQFIAAMHLPMKQARKDSISLGMFK